MLDKLLKLTKVVLVLGIGFPYYSIGHAENIDPYNEGYRYAWGENVGWINFKPSYGPGVTVTDTTITGYAWGENSGWINLSCLNTDYCSTVDFGVVNDGIGNLSGYAWGENVGWISFSCQNTASCGTVDYGVTIDVNGDFDGWAWGENVGWVSFSCQNTASCGTVDYGVRTSWSNDIDEDGEYNDVDNCPAVPNGFNQGTCSPGSENAGALCNSDSECSSCSTLGICSKNQEDVDSDGWGDVCDNCPYNCNNQQLDADDDGEGDVCDLSPGCGGCGPPCEQECTP